jgi:hypothetical protein
LSKSVIRACKEEASESDEKKEREHWFCNHSQNEYPPFISSIKRRKNMKATYLVAVLTILAVSFQAYGDPIDNMVANPSMEGNFDIYGVAEGWTAWNSNAYCSFYSGTSAHDGSKSQQFQIFDTSGNTIWDAGIYQQIIALEPDKIYDVSAWFQCGFDVFPTMYSPTGVFSGNCSSTFSIGIDTSGGTDAGAVTEWTSISKQSYRGDMPGQWIQIAASFIPDSTTATLFIKLNGSAYGMGEYYMPTNPPSPMMGPAGVAVTLNIDDVSVVPEPTTLLLLGLGGLGLLRRKRSKA